MDDPPDNRPDKKDPLKNLEESEKGTTISNDIYRNTCIIKLFRLSHNFKQDAESLLSEIYLNDILPSSSHREIDNFEIAKDKIEHNIDSLCYGIRQLMTQVGVKGERDFLPRSNKLKRKPKKG